MTEPIERSTQSKICESCGEPFGCGAQMEGCWCSEVQIPAEIANDLKTKYQDCLCPKCLMEIESFPATQI